MEEALEDNEEDIKMLQKKVSCALCYQGRDLQLRGYINANLGGDVEGRNSTSRYSSCLEMESLIRVTRSKHV